MPDLSKKFETSLSLYDIYIICNSIEIVIEEGCHVRLEKDLRNLVDKFANLIAE